MTDPGSSRTPDLLHPSRFQVPLPPGFTTFQRHPEVQGESPRDGFSAPFGTPKPTVSGRVASFARSSRKMNFTSDCTIPGRVRGPSSGVKPLSGRPTLGPHPFPKPSGTPKTLPPSSLPNINS